MSQTDYRVHLDAFEGPLDLLLYLVRKHEVELTEIPIAEVTDQYLDHLEQIDRIDIDLAGEFLLMAATLMEIKSRMLQPPEERTPDLAADMPDAGDPRADLIRQLLEYRKYRDTADALDRRRAAWASRFPAARAGVDDDSVRVALDELGELELEEVDLVDLCEAFQSIIAAVNFDRLGDHQIVSDDTPIELHEADLIDQLRRAGGRAAPDGTPRLPLESLLAGRTRPEMIGLFLALLTLVRDQRVGVGHDDEHKIVVLLREEDSEWVSGMGRD